MLLSELKEECEKAIPIARVEIEPTDFVDFRHPATVGNVGPKGWTVRWYVHILDKDFEWQKTIFQAAFMEEAVEDTDKKYMVEITLKRIVELYAKTRDKVSGMAIARKDYCDMLATVYGSPELRALYQQYGKILP